MIHANILTAIVYPKVHDTRIILRLTHSICNITTTLCVLYPELTYALLAAIGLPEESDEAEQQRQAVEYIVPLVGFQFVRQFALVAEAQVL